MDSMTVIAFWAFDVDTSDFDPKYVDISNLAIDLTKRELQSLLDSGDFNAEDFAYMVKENENV